MAEASGTALAHLQYYDSRMKECQLTEDESRALDHFRCRTLVMVPEHASTGDRASQFASQSRASDFARLRVRMRRLVFTLLSACPAPHPPCHPS